MMRAKVWLLTFLLAFESVPAQQAPDQTVIRVTSRLVQISVVVRDKHGELVRDLKREDFAVKDNGKLRDLAVFAPQVTNRTSDPSQPQEASAPPLRIRNRGGGPSERPTTLTLILLDSLNLPFSPLDRILVLQQAKLALIKFLASLEPGEPVGVYSLEGKLRVIHDFTQDTRALIESAKKYGSIPRSGDLASLGALSVPGGQTTPQFSELNEMMSASIARQDASMTRMRVAYTNQAFQAIARHLRGIPGRKNLVWISQSFPAVYGFDTSAPADARVPTSMEIQSFGREIEGISRAMSEANISIYPVDPQGLIADSRFNASKSNEQARTEFRQMQSPEIAALQNAIPTMESLAKETGGRAFYNTNDIVGSIRKAFDDSEVSYLLGYYPAESEWDGKYHKLEVKVNRPGMDVRTRKSYLAATPETPEQVKKQVDDAIFSPLDSLGIGIELNVGSNPLPVGQQNVGLVIDVRDLNLLNAADVWTGEFEIVFAQLAADGRIVKAETDNGKLNFKQERYQEMQSNGWFYRRAINVQPGVAKLRIVLHDKGNGSIGSVTLPVQSGKA